MGLDDDVPGRIRRGREKPFARPGPAPARARDDSPPTGEGRTVEIHVLLVDDSPSEVRLVREFLLHVEKPCFRVEPAGSLEQARKLLPLVPFDVILLDLLLPDSFGLDTVSRARAMAPLIPIVVLTGLDDPLALQESLVRGARAFLTKNAVKAEELVRVICAVVEESRAHRASRDPNASLRQYLERSADAALLLNTAGLVRFANPAAAELDQARPADLLGRTSLVALARDASTRTAVLETPGGPTTVDVTRMALEWDAEPATLVTFHRAYASRPEVEGQKIILDRYVELDQVRRNLVNEVAHELSNPLTPILIETQRLSKLLSGRLDAREQGAWDMLVRNAGRLGRLVQDLYTYAHIAKGPIGRPGPDCDLGELVARSADELRPYAERAHVEVWTGPIEQVHIEGDAEQIHQVLLQLIRNGIDASPPAQRVTVQATARESSALVEVLDPGREPDPDTLERLFKPFRNSETSADAASLPWAGLGLALSRTIVEAHGGRIWTEDRGAAVGRAILFTLPLAWHRDAPAPPGT